MCVVALGALLGGVAMRRITSVRVCALIACNVSFAVVGSTLFVYVASLVWPLIELLLLVVWLLFTS